MVQNTVYRGRFAPSPSGRMHLGNAFCALMAWLAARAAGGEMVLRIEDLDPDRSREEYIGALVDDLLWLGLDWDYGPGADNTLGPYRQSERTGLYAVHLARLDAQGLLYPCFCTRAQLRAASAPNGAEDTHAACPGGCRFLSAQEVEQRRRVRNPALRVVVPDADWTIPDGHMGTAHINLARDCGDFIVQRTDGVHAYQLAVTVDDALMGVTDVVRGRDLLSSVPRQLYLFEQLGYAPPRYAHIPLLVAPDGRRLSKRERDLDMGALRAAGVPPERVIGRLAFLSGLTDREEPLTVLELLPLFSWDKLTRTDIVVRDGF